MSADMPSFPPTASCTKKAPRFFFVNGNQTKSRKHAMREHWRKRKERKMTAQEHKKPFRLLHPTPDKDHMVCRMEDQSQPNDSTLSQDHPYSCEATSASTLPRNASHPLEGTLQDSVDPIPGMHEECSIRVTDASFDPLVPPSAFEDPVITVDTKGLNHLQRKNTELYDLNRASCVVVSKL